MTRRELSSMGCPKCGGAVRCLDSRPAPSNTIRRRRACNATACAHRFTTYELAIEGSPSVSPSALLHLVEQLERALGDVSMRVNTLKACAVVAAGVTDLEPK